MTGWDHTDTVSEPRRGTPPTAPQPGSRRGGTQPTDPSGQSNGQVLFGRDAAIAHTVAAATSPDSAPLILLTGPLGIGRTSVLGAVRDALETQSVSTLGFRVSRNERDRSYAVASRLSAELGALHRDVDTRTTRTGPVAEPRHGGVGRLVSALGAAMTTRRRLVVFVDDVQWIDPSSREALIPLVRTLLGMPVTFIGTMRWPLSDASTEAAALRDLQAAGLAEVVPLRPLPASAVDALVTHELQARPSVELSATLRRNCRGLPASVMAALDGYRRGDALRIVDRYAYLIAPERPPELAPDLRLFEHLRDLGEQIWSVAKALSVLYPFKSSAVRLITEATGIPEAEVRSGLDTLCGEGIVRRGPGPDQWRFAPPQVAIAVSRRLGQYERRRISQLAVTAIWAGEIVTDEAHLAEHLVAAGRFVDAKRAGDTLLALGAAAMLDKGYLAQRWLRAAIDLATEPLRRAQALLLHASTCCLHQQFAESAASAATLLSGHADLVPPESVLELEMVYIASLSGMGDTAALERIAEDGWRELPGGAGHRVVVRCAVLCLLDRWREANEQLELTWAVWHDDNVNVAAMGSIYTQAAAAYLGRMRDFDRIVAAPTEWPMWSNRRHRFALLTGLPRILMSFGELARASQMLTKYELQDDTSRPAGDRMIHDSLSGRWEIALDEARTALASGSALGYLPTHTVMCREAAIILTARGQLAQARTIIERAHTDQPILLHLVATPESELEHTLGATGRARQVIADALAETAEQGVVIGTDELWQRMAEYALADDDAAEAQRCASSATKVAELLGTGRAQLSQLITTALVQRDKTAAAQAIGVARDRAQPYELATAIVTLARHRVGDDALLPEAYELYGELDALLPRNRLRNLMRDRDIAVPGRSATVAENERLLAILVTEGLTNRELAVVLDTSEKSVESRLGRLFKRTGYRSRVELASAMLTGEYPS